MTVETDEILCNQIEQEIKNQVKTNEDFKVSKRFIMNRFRLGETRAGHFLECLKNKGY